MSSFPVCQMPSADLDGVRANNKPISPLVLLHAFQHGSNHHLENQQLRQQQRQKEQQQMLQVAQQQHEFLMQQQQQYEREQSRHYQQQQQQQQLVDQLASTMGSMSFQDSSNNNSFQPMDGGLNHPFDQGAKRVDPVYASMATHHVTPTPTLTPTLTPGDLHMSTTPGLTKRPDTLPSYQWM